MTTTPTRSGLGWGGRLLIALTLILVGAAAAAWALARYDQAARLLGVTSPPPATAAAQPVLPLQQAPAPAAGAVPVEQLATLEARLMRLEQATREAEGSAGRADALLVAFAARRAVDRGVALGYLENLLVERFGPTHPQAVASIVTGSRAPVSLADIVADYEQLGPELRRGGPQENWWTGFKRELGELVEIRRADRPSIKPEARYDRALIQLRAGEVDKALAETMRLPGVGHAGPWVAKARRYVAMQRALDEIESAALLPGTAQRR